MTTLQHAQFGCRSSGSRKHATGQVLTFHGAQVLSRAHLFTLGLRNDQKLSRRASFDYKPFEQLPGTLCSRFFSPPKTRSLFQKGESAWLRPSRHLREPTILQCFEAVGCRLINVGFAFNLGLPTHAHLVPGDSPHIKETGAEM